MVDVLVNSGYDSRRTFLKKSALMTVLPAIASVLGSTPLPAAMPVHDVVRKRRNIDQIDPSDYVHALTKLSERANNPNNDDNFFYYAWIHNKSSPPCEHNSHLFLPWHRALLYFFEQALQKVDPPRTKDVTLPYYNYTRLPNSSGKRYPSVYENSATVMGKMWTPTGWKESNRAKLAITVPFYSYSEDVLNLIEKNPNWSDSNVSTGGSISGFGGRPKNIGGKGAVESPQHDWMHDVGMAGPLRSTTTAAFDPIFWSFHTYEDLMFDLWVKRYGPAKVDGQDVALPSMPITCYVRDVLDVRKLGYEYEDDTPPPPAPVAAMSSAGKAGSFAQRKPEIARKAGEDNTTILRTYDVAVPAPGFKAAPFIIRDARILPTSYRGYIYLHPKSVPFNPRNELFRERYLVDYFAVLSMPQMEGHSMKTDLSFDLTGDMLRLADMYQGKQWVITVAVARTATGPTAAAAAGPSLIGPVELQTIK